MSKNARMAKKFYDEGLWNKARLRNLVNVGWITGDDYALITGESI